MEMKTLRKMEGGFSLYRENGRRKTWEFKIVPPPPQKKRGGAYIIGALQIGFQILDITDTARFVKRKKRIVYLLRHVTPIAVPFMKYSCIEL